MLRSFSFAIGLCVGALLGLPASAQGQAEVTLARERFKKIVANLKATVVIQHDIRDIDRLPAFPAAAK